MLLDGGEMATKLRRLLLPAVFLLVAPTVREQKTPRHVAAPSKVLNSRNDELMQCVNTDRLYSSRYATASLVYKMAMFERMGDFMGRHNLVAQFYLEDDEG